MTRRNRLFTLALAGALLVPGVASAASAFATTNVNLRAGPSTSYPAVNVVRGGDDVEVFGCLSNRSWCDVDYYGQRGWMSSNYLAFGQGSQRYTGVRVVERIRAPVVTFEVGNYWDDHYRGRSFYRDRDRYRGDIRREVRREIREERREDRRDWREDRRDDRRDWRDDRRDWREDRRDWREDRREWQADRRDGRDRYDGRRVGPNELVIEGRIN
jgi:uncharacterized protein YraI